MRIVTVVGTRPQFIKCAVVSQALNTVPEIEEILVHTGQHYDDNLSALFFDQLLLPKPDFCLGVGSGTHGVQTGQMLERIEQVLLNVKPDLVLVYGDTNSTLAGALAAAKLQVKLAHVESGLRSFNRAMPEEINRVITDHISDVLFTPTEAAAHNLEFEGIPHSRICPVGDVMFDAALFYGSRAEALSHVLERLELQKDNYILATIHRAENTDDVGRLHAIFGGLDDIGAEIPVVMPLHPRTRARLEANGLWRSLVAIRAIHPIGYLDMIMLERNARLIVTDSGGVQKEAFFYEVPCVTLRSETEWVELVEHGFNRIVPPTSSVAIASAIRDAYGTRPNFGIPLYGDGSSSQHIAEKIAATSRTARTSIAPVAV
jgi:UDP-GlcNAc3NAcA epimerase